jgi:hypothetical protein
LFIADSLDLIEDKGSELLLSFPMPLVWQVLDLESKVSNRECVSIELNAFLLDESDHGHHIKHKNEDNQNVETHNDSSERFTGNGVLNERNVNVGFFTGSHHYEAV